MTWNYRIVRYRQVGAGYGLHEVYYDDKLNVVSMTESPACFVAHIEEGPQGIIKSLTLALKDAQERPVLDEPNWNKKLRAR